MISQVVEMIDDELEGAENYALYALKVKADFPKLAQKMNELAGVELQHVRILHSEVEKLIQGYREEKGEPPKEMLAVYEFEHKKAIKKAAEIRSYIEEFNT